MSTLNGCGEVVVPAQKQDGCPDKVVTPEDFQSVLKAEHDEIVKSRNVRLGQKDGKNAPSGLPQEEGPLMGLAFSGGGIRSATFNLGILQALAERRILRRIDYLSTVSGGGYVGGWFTTWVKREGICGVEEKLDRAAGTLRDGEPAPISFLRTYSNYLTPKTGFFSADTWAAVSTYLRNLALNLSFMMPAVFAAIMLPAFVIWYLRWFLGFSPIQHFGSAMVLLLIGVFLVALNLSFTSRDHGPHSAIAKPKNMLPLIIIPLVGSALNGSIWIIKESSGWQRGYIIIAIGTILVAIIGWVTGAAMAAKACEPLRPWLGAAQFALKETSRGIKRQVSEAVRLKPHEMRFFLSLLGALAVGFGFLIVYMRIVQPWGATRFPHWYAATLGMPLMIILYMGVATVHIGIMGTDMPDSQREWWSRLGGWFFIVMAGWLTLFGAMVFGVPIIQKLKYYGSSVTFLAWLAATAAGVLAGRSPVTGKAGVFSPKEVIAKVAPYVFAAGVVLFSSALLFNHLDLLYRTVDRLMSCWPGWREHIEGCSAVLTSDVSFARMITDNISNVDCHLDYHLGVSFVFLAGVAFVISMFIDINQFSMHMLYRNRLVRCYLGASNLSRNADPITGFDPNDDEPLSAYRYDNCYIGPMPVVNTALNLVKGRRLAWQQRKAA